MAPRITISNVAAARAHIRPRCATRQVALSLSDSHRARGIAQSYLRKVAEGEERWKLRAEKIQNGELPHLWDVLDERGFIKDSVG